MANLVSLFVLVICILGGASSAEVVEKSRVYIVYLGEKKHEDPQLTVDSHYEMLTSVVGSKKLASDVTIHNYKHGFSGFAAKLTESQAQRIEEHPDVVHIVPNTFYKLQTTRSWDYLASDLGSHVPSNVPNKGNMGEDMIIGIIDSGIWPESESFNDEGLGPIPSRWNGKCVSGQDFKATQHCNRKIIGAQYINDGFLSDYDQLQVEINMTVIEAINVFSARDVEGHGTHVASIAAGSFVANASYKGLGAGTVRGGAPKARIAIYKVGWMYAESFSVCSSADVIKAMDLAVHDGVDVINLSLGSNPPIFPEIDRKRNKNAFASFHAVARGIPVVYGSGNNGPEAQMVDHPEPWVITVAASTIDRYLPTPITLGNNKTIMARGLSVGQETGFTSLIYSNDRSSCNHYSALEDATLVDGKVVLCFVNVKQAEEQWFADAVNLLADFKARGMVIAKNTKDEVTKGPNPSFQIVEVDFNIGTEILKYMQSTRSPMINLGTTKTIVGGQFASTRVAYFSSRGPNSLAPAILKPDITAPGVDILAAAPDHVEGGDHEGYIFKSGTSMSAPHITGIIALLKQAHPQWSPAALKSAIMTTAWNVNQYGLPITAGGTPKKIADPFDIGAGIVNPNSAMDPGLVYDMDKSDYVHYLCAMRYRAAAIGKFINQSNPCPRPRPSILDVNLPSITIPSLKNSTTVKRTVTNVGPVSSTYKATIQSPAGTVVSVRPEVLSFNSNTKMASFDVTVAITHTISIDRYNFGSLTWTDGGDYAVRIPVSVKADVDLPFGH